MRFKIHEAEQFGNFGSKFILDKNIFFLVFLLATNINLSFLRVLTLTYNLFFS